MYDRAQLRADLRRDEGCVNHAYRDSVRNAKHPNGILTVGVGWNLEANGIPPQVRVRLPEGDPLSESYIWPDECIDMLLDLGIDQAEGALTDLVPDWRDLDDARQDALLNLAFNMGKGHVDPDGTKHGLLSFTHFLAAVNDGRWDEAQVDLLGTPEAPSKYARDVGPGRSGRVAAALAGTDASNVA